MIDMHNIEDVGRRIGERFHPQRIILFGSYAEGRPTEDSDVDLMVIMHFKGTPVDQSVKIRMTIRPPFPMDLLVRTPEKIQERLKLGDPFTRAILTEGKIIYEDNHA